VTTKTVANKVEESLEAIQPPRGANYKALFEIAKWQAVCKLGESKLKVAWKTAQSEEGIIDSDDDLRALGEGTHIVLEQGRFSATAKVNAPRKTLDADALIEHMRRVHGVSAVDMARAFEACKKEGTAPLEKRVLEA
jgi:hypothetical protein